jgi:O-succinylbenzoate synthase
MLALERISVRLVELGLVRPFETHMGTQRTRPAIIVAVEGGGLTGWGEFVGGFLPLYFSHESIETGWYVLTQVLLPALIDGNLQRARDFHDRIGRIRGHRMAIASLEMALWDLQAKLENKSLARLLGGSRERIDVGVSLGIQKDIPSLLSVIAEEGIGQGYRRIKLKIKPGWDVEVVRAARKEFPQVPLTVDANGAYDLADAEHLALLDPYELLYIEQPLQYNDFVDHGKLQSKLKTDICLDESICCLHDAYQALELASCRNINIKPGRVGGLAPALAIHDLCRERSIPVWCGGMAETGIGKAHNIALASLPGFALPNDIAATRRHYRKDLVQPEWMLNEDGTISVPSGPGIGVDVDVRMLEELTVRKLVFPIN